MGAKSVTGVSGPGDVARCNCKQMGYFLDYVLAHSGKRITINPIGPMDGSNTVFTFEDPVNELFIYKNGMLLTQGNDYMISADGKTLTFQPSTVPMPGDVLMARVLVTFRELLGINS